MSIELALSGVTVHFVNINVDNGVESQEEILKHCTFPQLQDTEELEIWSRWKGYKDDFYIFDRQGRLQVYIPFSAGESTLSEPEQYQGVKDAILRVVAGDDEAPGPTPTDAEESDAAATDAPDAADTDGPSATDTSAADTSAAADEGDTSAAADEGDLGPNAPSEGSDAPFANADSDASP